MALSFLEKVLVRFRILRRKALKALGMAEPTGVEGKTTMNVLRTLHPFIPFCGGGYELRADATVRGLLLMFPTLEEIWHVVHGLSVPVLTLEEFQLSIGVGRVDAERLNGLFDRHGSDKGGRERNYGGVYLSVLALIPNPRRIVEVGIGSGDRGVLSNMGAGARPGASLRAWREWIPGVSVVGADVDRNVLFQEDGIETCFVDQLEPASFCELRDRCRGGIDLLIDDGLHSVPAGLTTLSFWLGVAREGDWFVVEDVHELQVPVWRAFCTSIHRGISSWVVSTGERVFVVVFRMDGVVGADSQPLRM